MSSSCDLMDFKSTVRWCVGNVESGSGGGKPKKVPYCPRTGVRLKPNEPHRWICSYEEALKVKVQKGYDFIGFLLTEDDPYHVTDIDDSSGPRVQWIIEEQNSYTEGSLFGKGIHIIGKAAKPDAQRKRFDLDGVGVESYDRARFIVFTGNVLLDAPIKDVQSWIDENVPMKAKKHRKIDPHPVDADDEEIVRLAMNSKHGERFKRLFEEGEWEGAGYGSQSEADMALCGILAYWSGCDPERMDRIFRSSALLRDKWDEIHDPEKGRSYGEMTIETAISNCTSTYNHTGRQEFIERLYHFRMNHRWEDLDCYHLYGAYLQSASLHGKYVEGEGVYVYGPARTLNLRCRIVNLDARDFYRITRTWRRLEAMGLVQEKVKGGPQGSGGASLYLIPEPPSSISTTRDNTGSDPNSTISLEDPVFPSVVRIEEPTPSPSSLTWIQKLTWTPILNKKQRMIIEQILYARNTLESLAKYFEVRKDNLKRTVKPLIEMGLVEEVEGEYLISEEKIERAFVGSGGLKMLHEYLDRIGAERDAYEKDGQEVNDNRSEQKIEAYLAGELDQEELTEWERNQAQARCWMRVVKNRGSTSSTEPVVRAPTEGTKEVSRG